MALERQRAESEAEAKKKGSDGMVKRRTTYCGDEKVFSSAKIEDLKKIDLREMRVRKVHRGRYLLARVASKPFQPFHIVAVTFAVVDPAGEAMQVSLYNTPLLPRGQRPSLADIDSFLPVGTILLIKEPWIKMALTGSSALLRVDAPSDVVLIERGDPVLNGVVWIDPVFTGRVWSAPEETRRSFDGWKNLGNKQLIAGQPILAEKSFSLGMDQHPSRPQLYLLHLNRAVVSQSLERFSSALADAELALSILSDAQPTDSISYEKLENLRQKGHLRRRELSTPSVDGRTRKPRSQPTWLSSPSRRTRRTVWPTPGVEFESRRRVIRRPLSLQGRTRLENSQTRRRRFRRTDRGRHHGGTRRRPRNRRNSRHQARRASPHDKGVWSLVSGRAPQERGLLRTQPSLEQSGHRRGDLPSLNHFPPSHLPARTRPVHPRSLPRPNLPSSSLHLLPSSTSSPRTPHCTRARQPFPRRGSRILQLFLTQRPPTSKVHRMKSVRVKPSSSRRALAAGSLFNRSCNPAAHWTTIGDVQNIRATSPIPAGAEIFISYAIDGDYDARQGALSKHLPPGAKECPCSLCSDDRKDGRLNLKTRGRIMASRVANGSGINESSPLPAVRKKIKEIEGTIRELVATYGSHRGTFRPELYHVYQMMAFVQGVLALKMSSSEPYKQVIENQYRALESIGVVVVGRPSSSSSTSQPSTITNSSSSKNTKKKVSSPPRPSDLPILTAPQAYQHAAVCSAIQVAAALFKVQDHGGAERWIRGAMWIEDVTVGGGKALFVVRYKEMLSELGLTRFAE